MYRLHIGPVCLYRIDKLYIGTTIFNLHLHYLQAAECFVRCCKPHLYIDKFLQTVINPISVFCLALFKRPAICFTFTTHWDVIIFIASTMQKSKTVAEQTTSASVVELHSPDRDWITRPLQSRNFLLLYVKIQRWQISKQMQIMPLQSDCGVDSSSYICSLSNNILLREAKILFLLVWNSIVGHTYYINDKYIMK